MLYTLYPGIYVCSFQLLLNQQPHQEVFNMLWVYWGRCVLCLFPYMYTRVILATESQLQRLKQKQGTPLLIFTRKDLCDSRLTALSGAPECVSHFSEWNLRRSSEWQSDTDCRRGGPRPVGPQQAGSLPPMCCGDRAPASRLRSGSATRKITGRGLLEERRYTGLSSRIWGKCKKGHVEVMKCHPTEPWGRSLGRHFSSKLLKQKRSTEEGKCNTTKCHNVNIVTSFNANCLSLYLRRLMWCVYMCLTEPSSSQFCALFCEEMHFLLLPLDCVHFSIILHTGPLTGWLSHSFGIYVYWCQDHFSNLIFRRVYFDITYN